MKVRTLIVDDEPLARERLRTLLGSEKDFEVVSECATGAEAVAAVRTQRPELMFLDVQMPGMDGFDVLRAIGREQLPLVIFVTAYDQHAVKAFEVHALDYLLKPFKQARFKAAILRVREALASRQTGVTAERLLEMLGRQMLPTREHLARIPVKTGERVVFIKPEQIEYVEAAGNYLVLHTARGNHILRETLTALEQELPPRKFLRISRSTLVNTECIKELQPLFKGEHVVVLHSGKQLAMTRGLREVQDFLKFS